MCACMYLWSSHILNNRLQSWNYTDIDFLARTNKHACHPSVRDLQDEEKKKQQRKESLVRRKRGKKTPSKIISLIKFRTSGGRPSCAHELEKY